MDTFIVILMLAVLAAVVWSIRKSANDRAAERKHVDGLFDLLDGNIKGRDVLIDESLKHSTHAFGQAMENKGIIEARFDHQLETLARLAIEVKRYPSVRGRDPETGKIRTMVLAHVDPDTGEIVRIPDRPEGWAGEDGDSG